MFFAWFGLFDCLFLVAFVLFLAARRVPARRRMIDAAPARRRGVELDGRRPVPAAGHPADGRERRRARAARGLAVATLDAPPAVIAALIGGWVLMPAILVASLRQPRFRYGLVVPASLVSLGLLAIVIGWLPAGGAAATGWVLLTAGVWLGGALGLWLWYRLAPVPAALDDPFSSGRWALVGLHVGLIVLGFVLAATALA